MKSITTTAAVLLLTLQFSYAQTKNYLSIENGVSFSGMSNRLSNSMKESHLADRIDYDLFFFLFFINSSTQYPTKENRDVNYKIRYGYNIKDGVSIEAGFGHSYGSTVSGASSNGKYVNELHIISELSTAYAAYLWKNKRANAAVGIGPAVSICKVTQQSPTTGTVLSQKNHLLPGVIFTGYWNFINKKVWFMGLRSDMSITAPAKTETVSFANPQDNSFITVSKGTSIGAVVNTLSLSAGIKF